MKKTCYCPDQSPLPADEVGLCLVGTRQWDRDSRRWRCASEHPDHAHPTRKDQMLLRANSCRPASVRARHGLGVREVMEPAISRSRRGPPEPPGMCFAEPPSRNQPADPPGSQPLDWPFERRENVKRASLRWRWSSDSDLVCRAKTGNEWNAGWQWKRWCRRWNW